VPYKHRSTEEDELTAAAGFEVRMLTVFFNNRLVHTLTLLPGGPPKDGAFLPSVGPTDRATGLAGQRVAQALKPCSMALRTC
jgi:hypothetical protein